MARKNLLHKEKLPQLKEWLRSEGWVIEETKAIFQMLRARKAGQQHPLVIYQKNESKEHLTVRDRDVSVIREFINANKKTGKDVMQMKNTGMIRKLDELGRVTLPIEIRRERGLEDGDPMEIFVDGEMIVLKKHETESIEERIDSFLKTLSTNAHNISGETFSKLLNGITEICRSTKREE